MSIGARVREWVVRKEREYHGLRRALVRFVPVAVMTVREVRRDLCLERAATLAFVTLISLIPFAVLFFSFAGQLGGGDEIIAYFESNMVGRLAPDTGEQVLGWLNENISSRAFKESRTGLLDVSAIAALVVSALALLTAAERIFNKIWRVAKQRSYFQRAIAFWVILTTSPLLIAGSMAIGKLLVPEGGWLDLLIRDSWILGAVYGFVVPVAFSFIGFALLLTLLPNTRVRWRSAAVGALIAAVLWELSKRGFLVYAATSARTTKFYGALATIPLFLVWVYLTWLILLVGSEITRVHQNLSGLLRARRLESSVRPYSQVFLGLTLLSRLRDAFVRGRPAPDLEEIAAELAVVPEHLAPIVEMLAREGYLVEDAQRARCYTLGREPATMDAEALARRLLALDFPQEIDLLEGERADLEGTAAPEVAGAWRAFLASLRGRDLGAPGHGGNRALGVSSES